MVHRYGPVPECSIPIAKTEWAPEWNLQVSPQGFGSCLMPFSRNGGSKALQRGGAAVAGRRGSVSGDGDANRSARSPLLCFFGGAFPLCYAGRNNRLLLDFSW
jgi:hypothetical protein